LHRFVGEDPAMAPDRGRRRARRRSALASVACALVTLAAPGLSRAAEHESARGAASEAPGLAAGPLITEAGVVWDGTAGITLLRADGSSQLLAPVGRPSWDNIVDESWFGERWWLLASTEGLVGGPIGGEMPQLPGFLQRCNPSAGSLALHREALFAVSGERLFGLLPPTCLPRRGAHYGTLVSVDLRTRRWRVLAYAPGAPHALAADGAYLALAFKRPEPPPLPYAALAIRGTRTFRRTRKLLCSDLGCALRAPARADRAAVGSEPALARIVVAA
jgi:hypothetical protein